jgi:hypothetical protein
MGTHFLFLCVLPLLHLQNSFIFRRPQANLSMSFISQVGGNMRRVSIILLRSAILAFSLAATAPASAADRICASWLYGVYLNQVGVYQAVRGRCTRWIYLDRAVPVFPFFRGPWFEGNQSPWITESQLKTQERALNPQPIPPGKKKKKKNIKRNV